MQKQTKPKKNVIFYRPKPFRYSKNCLFRIKIYKCTELSIFWYRVRTSPAQTSPDHKVPDWSKRPTPNTLFFFSFIFSNFIVYTIFYACLARNTKSTTLELYNEPEFSSVA